MGDPATAVAPIPSTALCLGCNYQLRGLIEHRCPECGRAFDPANARTMNLGRELRRFERRLLAPLGRRYRIALSLLVIWGAWLSFWMFPRALLLFLYAVPVLAFLTVTWSRIALRRRIVRQCRQPPDAADVDRAFLHRARLALWLIGLIIVIRLPMYAAWWASRLAMDRLAQRIVHGPLIAAMPQDEWVGLYRVTAYGDQLSGFNVALSPGVGFGYAGFDLTDERVGYGLPRRWEHMLTERLGGGWYTHW